MISRSRRLGGFTLIEIMIVVAILAILTLIALPKFGNMIRKDNEAGTKGHLGSVRGAIRLYYMDNDQVFPPTFSALRQVGGKYLSGTIMLYTGIHPTVDTVDEVLVLTPTSDAGHWAYVSGGADLGFFWIQCTHEDLTFTPWSRY